MFTVHVQREMWTQTCTNKHSHWQLHMAVCTQICASILVRTHTELTHSQPLTQIFTSTIKTKSYPSNSCLKKSESNVLTFEIVLHKKNGLTEQECPHTNVPCLTKHDLTFTKSLNLHKTPECPHFSKCSSSSA